MKRVIIFLSFLFLSLNSLAQLNNNIWTGNVTQNFGQRGISTGGIGVQIYTSFSDTAAANAYQSGALKLIPGCLIRCVDDLWQRSNDLQKWNKINGSSSGGSVTDFTAGNLSPLFNTNVATSTTTPALTFSPISQSQNLVYASPNGSSGNPSFRSLVTADLPSLNSLAWRTLGNSGIDTSINFIGTTDAQDVVFKTNNIEQFRALSSGGIQIPNSTGSSTGVIFKGSDRFIHSFALPGTSTNLGQNLFIGLKAGNFTMTGSSGGFGTRNLSIGDSTLYANTTGYRNVAIGVWNAAANTTGFENTTVGANAFEKNTTGRQNTAVGAISLENNTTGLRNTAVGFSSMQYGTTAERNVAIGGRAMQNVTTGFANAALGFDALAYNTTADHNVAVGLDALYYSNGSHNTAVGDSTLWGLFNGPGQLHLGYKNVAIGSRAGYHLGDTYPNYASIKDTAVTFLGANASRDPSVPYTTSLQNMTVIGYNARGTASNQVTIGNSSVTQHVFYGALMPNNLPGTSGQVLTSAGANANPTWTTLTSGANTALSNLTVPTAINTSLISDANNTDDLGSNTVGWRYGYFASAIGIGGGLTTPLAALDIRAADLFLTNSSVDQRFIIGEGLVSATESYAISWNRTDNQLVFNDGGVAVSMRLEGDNNANLFFADATNDRIGIKTSTPDSTLTVSGSAHITGYLKVDTDPLIYEALVTETGGVQSAIVLKNTTGTTFTVTSSDAGALKIDAVSGTPFTASKTLVYVSMNADGGSTGADYTSNYDITSTDRVIVYTYSGGSPTANIANKMSVKIVIYP